jgi:hypothetical protein
MWFLRHKNILQGAIPGTVAYIKSGGVSKDKATMAAVALAWPARWYSYQSC